MGTPLAFHANFAKKFKAFGFLVGEGTATVEQEMVYNITTKKVEYNNGSGVRTFLTDEDLISVHPDSAPYMELVGKQLRLKALAINTIKVDSTSTDLATFIAAEYTAGTELQEGDMVILPTAGQAYVHNGGNAGDSNDFALIETPGVSTTAIRAMFSASNGINYNPTTGEYKLGGVLTENTTITGGFELNLGGLPASAQLFAFKANASGSASIETVGFGLLSTWKFGAQMLFPGTGFIRVSDSALLVEDSRATKAGLEYTFTDWSGLGANSLTPKDYVDTAINTSAAVAVRQYADTISIIEGNPVAVAHNLNLTINVI